MTIETKKVNKPKKGAARKWAQRLKELGEQRPPQDLIDKLNETEEQKKIAKPSVPRKDMDL